VGKVFERTRLDVQSIRRVLVGGDDGALSTGYKSPPSQTDRPVHLSRRLRRRNQEWASLTSFAYFESYPIPRMHSPPFCHFAAFLA
jgi:hypothetical protein